MKRSSEEVRQKIIGLGNSSVKKSYYPLLQDKIKDLQDKQKELVLMVRSLEERESELEALLEEKTLLLAEVNHRVKNNLQIVTSLLNLGSGDGEYGDDEIFRHSVKRIEALSLVYQEFLFSDNYSEVMFCGFLKTISREIRSEAGIPQIKFEFEFPVEEIILNIDTAIPLALISFEAISSAFSCVELCGNEIIKVSLLPAPPGRDGKKYKMSVSVGETVTGTVVPLLKDSNPTGLPLVEALSQQISAEYKFENSGSGYSFSIIFG